MYYRHETRYDNGQLVDLQEMRKVAEKFPMSDPHYHDFLRKAFLQMRKNEIAFLKIAPSAHQMMYHNQKLNL